MTKIEAIEQVLKANGGSASLQVIYDRIEQFYPSAKSSNEWEAGIRGVLYRELKEGSRFKKIGLSIYALTDYQQEVVPQQDNIRIHSLMEGMCLELGNTYKYNTYTADPSALYRDNTYLRNVSSMQEIPPFTYNELIHYAKLVDVLWFSKTKLSFPKYAFEIVDSIGTLNGAINRCLQLQHFRTKFYIVAPACHKTKYEQTMDLEVYQPFKEMFAFKDYEEIQDKYNRLVQGNQLEWL